jgi:predicted nuclease of predicted toxin-antitoxin system
MRFIIDTQLPPRLASFLESKGHDSIHTTHFENGHLLQDKNIIDIAINQNRQSFPKTLILLTITTSKVHHRQLY